MCSFLLCVLNCGSNVTTSCLMRAIDVQASHILIDKAIKLAQEFLAARNTPITIGKPVATHQSITHCMGFDHVYVDASFINSSCPSRTLQVTGCRGFKNRLTPLIRCKWSWLVLKKEYCAQYGKTTRISLFSRIVKGQSYTTDPIGHSVITYPMCTFLSSI